MNNGFVPFDCEIVDSLNCSNALIVVAGGFANHICNLFCSQFAEGKELIILLNWSSLSTFSYSSIDWSIPIRHLNASIPSEKRRTLYSEGGIVSITSRILAVDILQEVIDCRSVMGVLVGNIESVPTLKRGSVSFALDMLRNRSSDNCWVRGISENACYMVHTDLEYLMTLFGADNIIFYPRFRASVLQTFNRSPITFDSLSTYMTPLMLSIRNCLVSCFEQVLKSIQRSESYVLKSTLDIICSPNLRSELMSFSKETSSVDSLCTIRRLLFLLETLDSSSFYCQLLRVKNERPKWDAPKGKKPDWLFLDGANALFTLAKKRASMLELDPKWSLLLSCLDSLRTYQRILVLCATERSCEVVSRVISYKNCSDWRNRARDDLRHGLVSASLLEESSAPNQSPQMSQATQTEYSFSKRLYVCCLSSDRLRDISPEAVVFYDVSLKGVREFELYALHNQVSKVIMLEHDPSFQYKSMEVERLSESEAFEKLIRSKSSLDLLPDLRRKKAHCPPIVVDVREFTSAVPFEIHALGLSMVPKTLRVGDYVLGKDAILERKSTNDLFGSFQSGRLFQQCRQMFSNYANVFLLVELDDLETFKSKMNISPSVPHRLAVLQSFFTKLRIVWSLNCGQSASLIRDLSMKFETQREFKEDESTMPEIGSHLPSIALKESVSVREIACSEKQKLLSFGLNEGECDTWISFSHRKW